ncbi:YchJ family protein [Candidatus Sodalis sp. SoCistrobi]|uniref:YchJ family protein n=1 Tax=Candidatus Sodalis sp. SoCistrobi TaxID=1922216 RepID=UPI00093C24A7|nr:YchJ family protein [Candidatus Sodalis sp. SoCistrobi]
MRSLCPCDSGKLYADCCAPSIEGALPATPEQLMRSRYSAYVLHNVNYLIATWHPEAGAEAWRDDITAGFHTTRWRGLEVQECAAGQDSNWGYVTFLARFYNERQRRNGFIHERSRFVRLNERWYYVDGRHIVPGRNVPCPCGSGFKYKKCCGQ